MFSLWIRRPEIPYRKAPERIGVKFHAACAVEQGLQIAGSREL